jgi:hypothetical protein
MAIDIKNEGSFISRAGRGRHLGSASRIIGISKAGAVMHHSINGEVLDVLEGVSSIRAYFSRRSYHYRDSVSLGNENRQSSPRLEGR